MLFVLRLINLGDGFFFFQAEDGIRGYKVTGVQTCALPILPRGSPAGQFEKSAENSRWWPRQFLPGSSLSQSQAYAPLPPRKQARCACRDTVAARGTERPSRSECSPMATLSQRREGSAFSDRSNSPQRKSGNPCPFRAVHLRACW